MNHLENIVDKICSIHEDNNSFPFYQDIILCCIKCIELLDKNLLSNYELKALKEGANCWENEYDENLLDGLHKSVALKSGEYATMTEQRKSTLQAELVILLPYEKWEPQGYERPYTLEYFAFYLKQSGVEDKDLLPILNNFYKELIKKYRTD